MEAGGSARNIVKKNKGTGTGSHATATATRRKRNGRTDKSEKKARIHNANRLQRINQILVDVPLDKYSFKMGDLMLKVGQAN